MQRLISSLQAEDLRPCQAGVGAQVLGPNGELIKDFNIEEGVNSIHILNAPSLAATAALAIGQAVTQMATQHFSL